MKMPKFFLDMQAEWQKRLPHERRILSIVAVLILSSMIYLIGFEPAINNIKQLEVAYPVLKQQTAKMSLMTDEYSVISQALSENIPPVTRELIESSLLRKNMRTQSLSVSNDVVRVQVNVAAYSQLMEWLLEMQKASRLTVEDAKVTTLDVPGQVSFVITLRQQKLVQ
jgi:general secretion pathway protein M